MDQLLENLLLANIKGTFETWKYKKNFYLAQNFFVILRSLSIRRIILSPPKMVQQIFFLNETLTFLHNLLRKSTNFNIGAQKILTLVYL